MCFLWLNDYSWFLAICDFITVFIHDFLRFVICDLRLSSFAEITRTIIHDCLRIHLLLCDFCDLFLICDLRFLWLACCWEFFCLPLFLQFFLLRLFFASILRICSLIYKRFFLASIVLWFIHDYFCNFASIVLLFSSVYVVLLFGTVYIWYSLYLCFKVLDMVINYM